MQRSIKYVIKQIAELAIKKHEGFQWFFLHGFVIRAFRSHAVSVFSNLKIFCSLKISFFEIRLKKRHWIELTHCSTLFSPFALCNWSAIIMHVFHKRDNNVIYVACTSCRTFYWPHPLSIMRLSIEFNVHTHRAIRERDARLKNSFVIQICLLLRNSELTIKKKTVVCVNIWPATKRVPATTVPEF